MLPRDSAVALKRRQDYRPPAFVVDTLDLTLDLAAEATEVTATLAFRRNAHADAGDREAPLVLDGEQQEGVAVDLDGVALRSSRAQLTPRSLTILDPPDAGTLTVRSRIAPARNVALEGLYVSSGVFCTQCEPEGFRRITYFPDRPDVLARYTVTLRADRTAYPVLLSNGNLVAQGSLARGRHFATWQDPFPKPSYLFAAVAGALDALEDTFVTRSGKHVALRIYSTRANIPRCRHAMEAVKKAFRWDEERFGREYDLDAFMIFCADDFNMGAMENKGLNIFNSRLVLADPATATDDDYQAIEGVIGHEYFHNWTGNRVTCRDWFQLSLKEGLTVFRDQEFTSDLTSRAVERIAAVEFLRREQYPGGRGTDGAQRASRRVPRDQQFLHQHGVREGCRADPHAAHAARTGALPPRHRSVLRASRRHGRDLRRLRAGDAGRIGDRPCAVPPLVCTGGNAGGDGARRGSTPQRRRTRSSSRSARRRHRDSPRSFRCTFRSRWDLLDRDGRDIPLRLPGEAAPVGTTRVLELRGSSQTFRFAGIGERPVPSLLRNFSAPIIVDYPYTDETLAFLAAHDSDAVTRWDAAQRCYANAMLALARCHREGSR